MYEDESQTSVLIEYVNDVLLVLTKLIKATEFHKLLDILHSIFK